MNRYGYNGTILWIDLSERSSRVERPDDGFWRLYGGGGLAAVCLLLRNTQPGLDPFDPDNLLIFASSVVAGTDAPGLARFTTAAKSPLTGGIGETRTEGTWGPALKASGADIIVIKGRADDPVAVEILPGAGVDGNGVAFHSAEDLWGANVDTAVDGLERLLGIGIHTAVIGPAGENLVRFASIVTDRSYQASRMGMGAVMGSKRLKAVVLNGGEAPPVHDPAALSRIRDGFETAIPQNSLSKWQHDPPGFSCWIYLHGLDASLCAENYSKSEFPLLDAYAEEKYAHLRIEDLPCPGCTNNCIKSIIDPKTAVTDHRSGGIHQEITGTMGPNLGIGDLSFIVEANLLCNRYGLDPTSLGFTISFAMECYREGIISLDDNLGEPLRFGNGDDALRCIEDIVHRRGLGDILAEGTKRAGRLIGGKAPSRAWPSATRRPPSVRGTTSASTIGTSTR